MAVEASQKRATPCSMRIFASYEGERVILDIEQNETVEHVKETVREIFSIGPDEGASGAEVQERKILSLVYAGAVLDNSWILSDLGILSGSTIKAVLKDEIKPSVFVYCVFSGDTIPLFDKINARIMTVEQFRGIVSRKVGLPVSVFRLMSDKEDGREMFSARNLDDYGVGLGHTVRLETWDGWTELLNLAIMGFASHVMMHLSSEEIVARFQMKVALYIAAHYGHIDLAVSLLRQGLRADEPVGEHPTRQWCKDSAQHIDSLKAPVHEAAEAGQLGVLRSFVHHNVCNVLAKDGNGLTALNISLRRRQKACASFLLTKQWNKVSFTKKTSIPLSIFNKMKKWSDKAKDRVLLVHGQWKSSMKNPRRHGTGALIDYGVQLDGYSKSKLASKTSVDAKLDRELEEKQKQLLFDIYEEERRNQASPTPDVYFKTLSTVNTLKLPKLNRLGRILSKVVQDQNKKEEETKQTGGAEEKAEETDKPQPNPEPKKLSRSDSKEKENQIKLPPIKESRKLPTKYMSQSHQNLTTGVKEEPEFHGKRIPKTQSMYFKTPGGGQSLPDEKPVGGDKPKPEPNNKMAKEPTTVSSPTAVFAAKSRSSTETPRTKIVSPRSVDLPKATLSLYEKYRGQKSRDYALRCLSVASSFKEKAWLQQVNQAMLIARRGVKKIVDGQPNLFSTGDPPPSTFSGKHKVLPGVNSSVTSSQKSLKTI